MHRPGVRRTREAGVDEGEREGHRWVFLVSCLIPRLVPYMEGVVVCEYKLIANFIVGITNQRETAVVWSRKTGKPLARAIVWDDARTRDIVAHYEKKLREEGIEHEGELKKGDDAVVALKTL